MKTKIKRWRQDGEWSSTSVRHSRTGWIMEHTSRFAGDLDGLRVLVPYTAAPWGYTASDDLGAAHNATMSIGRAIADYATGADNGRILRRGAVVR